MTDELHVCCRQQLQEAVRRAIVDLFAHERPEEEFSFPLDSTKSLGDREDCGAADGNELAGRGARNPNRRSVIQTEPNARSLPLNKLVSNRDKALRKARDLFNAGKRMRPGWLSIGPVPCTLQLIDSCFAQPCQLHNLIES
jgi:hypothetical protein